jgi:hypothetical protein
VITAPQANVLRLTLKMEFVEGHKQQTGIAVLQTMVPYVVATLETAVHSMDLVETRPTIVAMVRIDSFSRGHWMSRLTVHLSTYRVRNSVWTL